MAQASVEVVMSQLNTYQDRGRVIRDVTELLKNISIQKLKPTIGNFIQNDGTIARNLLLSGTLPIFYRTAQV